jgi:hypothetical protein
MTDSRFWRAVAVVTCGGLIYVGHGLNNPGNDGARSFVNVAHAGGVAVAPVSQAPWNQVVTASPDGRTIYLWGPEGTSTGYVGTASVPPTTSPSVPNLQRNLPVRKK